MSSAPTPTVIGYMMAALGRMRSIDDATGAVQGHLSNAYDLAMRKQRPTDQIVDCGVRAHISKPDPTRSDPVQWTEL